MEINLKKDFAGAAVDFMELQWLSNELHGVFRGFQRYFKVFLGVQKGLSAVQEAFQALR